jgi:acylphosphatase
MQFLTIKIYGKVQGVFFRDSARKKAKELGIKKAEPRNEPDGTVVIEITGKNKRLEKFIAWCHQGPSLAKVEKIQVCSKHKMNN